MYNNVYVVVSLSMNERNVENLQRKCLRSTSKIMRTLKDLIERRIGWTYFSKNAGYMVNVIWGRTTKTKTDNQIGITFFMIFKIDVGSKDLGKELMHSWSRVFLKNMSIHPDSPKSKNFTCRSKVGWLIDCFFWLRVLHAMAFLEVHEVDTYTNTQWRWGRDCLIDPEFSPLEFAD